MRGNTYGYANIMKLSIITVVYNGVDTIEDCIKSIINQSYGDKEYIIIDGGSTDGTLDVIGKYNDGISKIISGSDDGMYDALNKGIGLATGDIIGFLHSDDLYASNEILEKVVDVFENNDIESCYGDLLYVNKFNYNKTIRYWKSSPYKDGKFRSGWMPPHPTFFVKKEIYNKYGCFNTDFRIAADYELMLRFFEKYKISSRYIPEVFIKMRVGGMSNRGLRNLLRKSFEDYKAWKVNGLYGGGYTILLKIISKLPQFFVRK